MAVVANRPLSAVPSLDQLARDPSAAHALAPAVVAALLGRAHVAIAALEARLLVSSIERKEPSPADREPARLMTAEEVSERLGFKPGYVYELARAGKIKSLKQGKYIRFTEAAVSEFIVRNGSAVDTELNNVLSMGDEPGRVQKRPQRNGAHANGTSTPPGRAFINGQPMGARVCVDS